MESRIRITILCFTLLIGTMGCASLQGTATIKETTKGVKFEASRPAKMTYKRGDVEYTYDSQAPSLLSRIMSTVTLGVVGVRR